MQNNIVNNKPRLSIVEKPIGKIKNDINLSTFALLVSEMVQYSHKRSSNLADFQTKLAEFGRSIGVRLLELTYFREKKINEKQNSLNNLVLLKNIFGNIYGKEADSVERHANDPLIYYIIEKDPIINKFLPKDRSIDYSCAYLNAGIIDSILNESNFPCKVDLVNGEGCVYYAISFEKSVIMKDKQQTDLK